MCVHLVELEVLPCIDVCVHLVELEVLPCIDACVHLVELTLSVIHLKTMLEFT